MNLGDVPNLPGTGTAAIANYMPSIFTSVPDLLQSDSGTIPVPVAAPSVPSIMGFPLTQKNLLILLGLYLFLRR